MINEQIKKEISTQLDKKLMETSLDKIILNSNHHVLMFAGLATTTASQITPRYDPTIIQNKKLLIKRVQVIPYANHPVIDILFSDGTSETVPGNMRLQRTLETYSTSLNLRFLVNGNPIPMFLDDPAGGTFWYPLDLDCDNIYYLYKEPVQNLLFQAATTIYTDFSAATAEVLLNILVECYSF